MNIQDLVSTNEKGIIVTTSLKVAEVFEKEHKNVLQSIELLKPDLSTDFWELNFQLSNYESKSGRNTVRKNPMYLLTKDAFFLLAMGFTGKKAVEFKEAFIGAFNKMQDELNKMANIIAEQQKLILEQKIEKEIKKGVALELERKNRYINAKERSQLRRLVKLWVMQKHLPYPVCYKKIHKKFGITGTTDITKDMFNEICNYVRFEANKEINYPAPPLVKF